MHYTQTHANNCTHPTPPLQALTRSDIEPALATLKRKLMERNVAEEIADKWASSLFFLFFIVPVCSCLGPWGGRWRSGG